MGKLRVLAHLFDSGTTLSQGSPLSTIESRFTNAVEIITVAWSSSQALRVLRRTSSTRSFLSLLFRCLIIKKRLVFRDPFYWADLCRVCTPILPAQTKLFKRLRRNQLRFISNYYFKIQFHWIHRH